MDREKLLSASCVPCRSLCTAFKGRRTVCHEGALRVTPQSDAIPDFFKPENLGEVLVGDVCEKGAIEGDPGLQAAVDLGARIA